MPTALDNGIRSPGALLRMVVPYAQRMRVETDAARPEPDLT